MEDFIQIRSANEQDAPAIARVHVDSWRQTYAGIVAAEFLVSLSYERGKAMWRQTLTSPINLTLVAESRQAGIVGFVSAGAERSGDPFYTSEVYSIYLLKDHWRQGIGRRLFCAAARGLHQSGHSALLVWVLKENPARRFYEALGGTFVREQGIQIGEQQLIEVAYGWRDTARLISGQESPTK